MKVLIIGGGKIGYYLAKSFSTRGNSVTVVESDRVRGQRFANEIDVPVIWGDGSSAAILQKAGVQTCDVLIAVTGRDEDNLVACQSAKQLFGVKKTVAKVNNPKNTSAITALGIDYVVSSTEYIIQKLEHDASNSRLKELFRIEGGAASVFDVDLPRDYVFDRKMIQDISLPENCNIISITRDGELIIPRGKTKLLGGDQVLVIAENGAAAEVRRALKIK
ncbi:MAG: NAD-binding protein [Oscillospiraceae bacterium]|jgi:trk system potassium uptake protein TrkA|nr:NAD-binding protein [Oscillospiraceae bacterium]